MDKLREKQSVLGEGVNHMHIFLQSYIKTCVKFKSVSIKLLEELHKDQSPCEI